MVRVAGFPPASFRLEDGCLMCSATAAIQMVERQDFHLRPPGPKPGALKTELRSEKTRSQKVSRSNAPFCLGAEAGSISHAPGPSHFNKEQTPPGDRFDPSPRIHGGCFGV